MTAHYCRATDVNDKQIQALVNDTYLADTDSFINDLALRLGLAETDIEVPLTYTAKKLALAFLCKTIAQDNIGINVQANGYGVEVDLYKVKYNIWSKEFDRLVTEVTAEVLSGDADTPPEFANMGIPLVRS
jgi:hypothetical protein